VPGEGEQIAKKTKGYLDISSGLAFSAIFVAPLLLAYEVGIALVVPPLRNGAEIAVKLPLSFLGPAGALVFNFLIAAGVVAAYWRLSAERHFRALTFFLLFLESTVYAVALVLVALLVQGATLAVAAPVQISPVAAVLLSIGAGVYEEFLFRLLLTGLLFYLLKGVAPQRSTFWPAMISVTLSALIFAAAHYVGSVSDTFSSSTFAFRFLAGLYLSAVYASRGLGAAVYTHAIYDVIVFVVPLLVEGR